MPKIKSQYVCQKCGFQSAKWLGRCPECSEWNSLVEEVMSARGRVPGSLGQVREAAGRLLTFAKTRGVPVLLIGHVTKDGGLAGPKTLEHVVDAVLYFEGDEAHSHRILRATKNRFGSVNELGVFEM